jgi:hypothetical protein
MNKLSKAIEAKDHGELLFHTQDIEQGWDAETDDGIEDSFEETFDQRECEGHDSVTAGDYDTYPHTVYCNGSCIRARWGHD